MQLMNEIQVALEVILNPAKLEQGAMVQAIKSLDTIWKERGRELSPDLVHYLQRRSYEKALAFIEADPDDSNKRGPGGLQVS